MIYVDTNVIVRCLREDENTEYTLYVMNWLDPIEELYAMYSEEEDTPRIVEIEDNGLGLDLDVEELADPYMDL